MRRHLPCENHHERNQRPRHAAPNPSCGQKQGHPGGLVDARAEGSSARASDGDRGLKEETAGVLEVLVSVI